MAGEPPSSPCRESSAQRAGLTRQTLHALCAESRLTKLSLPGRRPVRGSRCNRRRLRRRLSCRPCRSSKPHHRSLSRVRVMPGNNHRPALRRHPPARGGEMRTGTWRSSKSEHPRCSWRRWLRTLCMARTEMRAAVAAVPEWCCANSGFEDEVLVSSGGVWLWRNTVYAHGGMGGGLCCSHVTVMCMWCH